MIIGQEITLLEKKIAWFDNQLSRSVLLDLLQTVNDMVYEDEGQYIWSDFKPFINDFRALYVEKLKVLNEERSKQTKQKRLWE